MDQNDNIQVVDAREVYVLMRNQFRVSRNTRASWFFKHLNTVLDFTPVENEDELCDSDGELVIISVVPKTVQASSDATLRYKLTPQTNVTFLAHRYRLVFVLDVSPSSASVDHSNVLVDDMYRSLDITLRGVVQPFHVPGSQLILRPEIFVSVIAHTSLINCSTNQVLVQGVLLTSENVDHVLGDVTRQLLDYENMVAKEAAAVMEMLYEKEHPPSSGFYLSGGMFDDIVSRPQGADLAQQVVTPEANFVNMLRFGILGLQLLPDNSAAGIVIITDGVLGFPEAALFDSLLSQLRHSTIECSFIQMGRSMSTGLGHVAFPQLMQFIALATFGAYINRLPDVESLMDPSYPMNLFHHAFLTWSFQKSITGGKVSDYMEPPVEDHAQNLVWTHRVPGFNSGNLQQWSTPLMRKKHAEKNQHTAISNLICCRLREGYHIREVHLTKGESQLEVVMVLPWRENVRIVYVVASAWPLSKAKRQTHVEVTIEASYDFMHDSIRTVKTKTFRSPYRSALIRRFWQTLQGMFDTDQLLVHLQSFSSQAVYYKVPESVERGVPLFYLLPTPSHNAQPQLNQQLNAKDSTLAQFAAFWKLALMLDINIWQKWMHTQRVGVVLEHDEPLGRHLHVPNSSDRFHTVQCSHALTALNFFLRDYSTFVLMDNHAYIRLLFGDGEEHPPTSFYVIRLASKPPCLVLRLAFLGGTPGTVRNQIVTELREAIAKLNFPQRGSQKDGKESGASIMPSSSSTSTATSTHRPPLQRLWSETPCCVLTKKPMEKILMRYERMPQDFGTLGLPPVIDQSGQLTHITSANKAASSIYLTLAKYLYHRRWVWCAQHAPASNAMPTQAVGRILSTLTKIRLQQGFNFAHAHSGIITMASELQMKNPDIPEPAVCKEREGTEAEQQQEEDEEEDEGPCLDGSVFPCVMQYVVFPPHITTSCREMLSVDDEGDEEETAEADGELQIITECWLEPQYGEVVFSPPERQHFDGLSYKQLPNALLPTDYEAISSMLTFEHLNLVCQSPTIAVPPPLHHSDGNSCHSLHGEPSSTHPSINHMPFPFNLLALIPKCQQVQLQFSTYLHGVDEAESYPNDLLFSLLVDKLIAEYDRQIPLTTSQCKELLHMIQSRGPHSFAYRPGDGNDDPDQGNEVPVKRSESSNSVSTNVSSLTNHSGLSSMTNQTEAMKQGSSSASKTQVPDATAAAAAATEPEPGAKNTTTPNWLCFVKSISGTHIMLCFLPASYADLRMLMKKPGADLSTEAKKSSAADNAETNTKSRQQSGEEKSKRKASEDPEEKLKGKERQQSGDKEESRKPDSEGNATKDKKPSGESEKAAAPDDKAKSETVAETLPETKINIESDKKQTTAEQTDKELLKESKSPGTANDTADVETKQAEKASDDVKEAAPEVVEPLEEEALELPVYIYNCPLNIVTEQLVNKWTYKRPEDIAEDLTFKRYTESIGASSSPCRSRVPSGGEEGPRRISENERWRAACQENNPLYGQQDELRQHCSMVAETFFRCFVTGVFRSLQHGDRIAGHDVDAAVDSICEESVPLELDITRFVHCVCGHARQVVERASRDRLMKEDIMKTAFPEQPHPPLPTQIEEDDNISQHDQDDLQAEEEQTEKCRCETPQPLLFPLALLQQSGECESQPGLHQIIRSKFSAIMDKFFRPIPSCPDFYLYAPAAAGAAGRRHDDDDEVTPEKMVPDPGFCTIPQLASADFLKVGDDDSDVFTFKDGHIPTDRESVASIHDSLSCLNDDDVDLSDHEDAAAADQTAASTPLFIYLMCTVRYGRHMRSIPLHSLPTCLSELKECFGDVESTVDLSQTHITLDVTCMTLPPETDLQETPQRPCYTRMLSNMSQISNLSMSGSAYDMSGEVDGGASPRESAGEPFTNLLPAQREAVREAQKQIQWLLTDEIASALRCIVPVSMETLEMVATHVKGSEDQPMCFAETVPLQFVYGPEQSLTPFIEAFERMSLDRYRLNKEGHYYYLYVDSHPNHPYAHHAQALNCALNRLEQASKDPNTADSPDVCSPNVCPPLARPMYTIASKTGSNISMSKSDASTSRSEASNLPRKDSQPDVPFKLRLEKMKSPVESKGKSPAESSKGILKSPSVNEEDKQLKIPEAAEVVAEVEGSKSPGRVPFKIKKFLVSPVNEPEGGLYQAPKQDEQPKPKINEPEPEASLIKERKPSSSSSRPPSLEVTVHDTSIEVLSEDATKITAPGIEVSQDVDPKDVFKAEDIRISVTRPSPVKEVRRLTQEKEVEESEDPDPGTGERRSSGSSIQVLEDDTEDPSGVGEGAVQLQPGTEVASEAHGGEEVETRKTDQGMELEPLSVDASTGTVSERSQLSPLTVTEPNPAAARRNNLHRAHSSASFEKYMSEQSMRDSSSGGVGGGSATGLGGGAGGGGGVLSLSGMSTPRRHSSGGAQLPRGLHHDTSGGTPVSMGSALICSSRASWGEAGYDGDSSESEDGAMMLSLSDSMVVRHSLPHFWLIMKIDKDRVDVYFHARENCSLENICNKVIMNITQICRMVNQRLLLNDLWASRLCNNLLVPEADEDVKWKTEPANRPPRRNQHSESSDDSEGEKLHNRYLAANLQFVPGHFSCNCVWETTFIIHPRLKQAPVLSSSTRGQRGGGLRTTLSGLQTLKSVLSKFSVANRKNMFVIQERNRAVFYLRLYENEDDTVQKRHSGMEMAMSRPEDDTNLTFSRSSSLLSLPIKRMHEEDDSLTPMSPRRPSASNTVMGDAETMSLQSSLSKVHTAPGKLKEGATGAEETITLKAYGIGAVGDEISKDLVQMLQRKLDDSVLDILTVMLSRNPLCKLSSQDVKFIQKPFTPPTRILRLKIPSTALLQQYALGYYLRQNLLQISHPPKYADSRQDHVFRDYSGQQVSSSSTAPALHEATTFLYNKAQTSGGEKGGKGIALLHLSFVDGLGQPITLLSCPKPSPLAYRDTFDSSMFPGMVDVQVYHDSSSEGANSPAAAAATEGGGGGGGQPLGGLAARRKNSPKMKSPGPTALVQFSLWERGNPDTATLRGALLHAMKCAVCDIVMEYRLLTAPVCEVPQHYTRHGVDSPMHSAPPSPMGGHSNESRSVPSQSVKKQISMVETMDNRAAAASGPTPGQGQQTQAPQPQGGGLKTPKEKSAFSFMSDVFKSKSREKVNENISAGAMPSNVTWQELEAQRRKDLEIRQKIHRYETGERGSLHLVFCGIMHDWMDFINKIGVPTVQKFEVELVSRFPTDYLLKELQGTANSISPDIDPKVFRRCSTEHDMDGEDEVYEPYLSRLPVQAQESKHESSLDMAPCPSCCRIPGKTQHFIVVGRNVKQWRASIDYSSVVAMDDPHAAASASAETLTHPKTQKSYQKYKPLEEYGVCAYDSSTPLSDSAGPATPGPSPPVSAPQNRLYVPRQRFMLATLHDKKLSVFTYNWASELTNRLAEHVSRMVEWHNARAHLLTCILSQKLGLFQHAHFAGYPVDPVTKEMNAFTSSLHELDLLVKCTVPSQSSPSSSASSSSAAAPSRSVRPASMGSGRASPHPLSRALGPGYAAFEQLYRDAKPAVPMAQHASYAKLRDPCHRHGAQMLELRGVERRETEKRMELEELYMTWQQRSGTASNVAIRRSGLELLKHSSRLSHSVATPLLFSPQWRKKLSGEGPTPNKAKRHDSGASDSKSRSRHSSGASIKSKRSDTLEAKRSKGSVLDSPEMTPSSPKVEEVWHMELRHRFLNDYMQYLQKCGFSQVKIRPPSPKPRSRHQSGRNLKPTSPQPCDHPLEFTYLQKTLPGGIMLIEVGFREVNFCLHVYAFECTRLAMGKTVNKQLAMIFTDECDKFKDLTHVHSFAHDFHLRTVQSYLSGRPLANFKQNYHLTAFLRDFKVHYPHMPSYSRNALYEGTEVITNTNSSGHHLFKYMLEHEKQYKMRAVKMNPVQEDGDLLEDEHALVCQYQLSGTMISAMATPQGNSIGSSSGAGRSDYTVGLVITRDTQDAAVAGAGVDNTSLRLRYWVLLTNNTQPFPKQKLEKKLCRLASMTKQPYPASIDDENPEVSSPESEYNDQSARSPPVPGGELPPSTTPTTEAINYLGYINRDITTLSDILLHTAQAASARIRSMVQTSMAQCRRDILWNRMLMDVTEEPVGRRKHRSGWQEPEEPKDVLMTRLTFEEFKELLDGVEKVRLGDIDPQLLPLHNMTHNWYHGLLRVLMHRYDKTQYRSFNSTDGLLQYVVILNPNNLDELMMVGVDNMGGTTELCAVYREKVDSQPHTPHNPNFNLLAVHEHIASFVNACCYHMWTRLL